MRAIEARQKQIADGLAAGEEARQSLAQRREADRADDDRGQGAGLRDRHAGREAQERDSRSGRSEAKAEADRIVAAAKADIEQEVQRAKEALRDQVAELAVAGARKILEREVDAKTHAELLAALQRQL